MKAVFLDGDSLNCADLDTAGLRGVAADWDWYPATAPEQVVERIRDAEIVVVNKVVLGRDELQAASSLKLICVAATGTDNVDLQAASGQGISVSNCQAYGTNAVAQHVMMLMLTLSTRLLSYQRAVREGRWQQSPRFCLLDYPIVELAGKTLGIVGYGVLGKRVAALAEGFGMQVLVADRPGAPHQQGRLPLASLLPRIDYLSLHCPLTDDTRGLIDAEALAQMKPGAFVINAARGGIVDEQALVDALEAGHLAGAGFDVLSQEPPSADNPLLQCRHPNLIVTPHSAWGSRESRQRILEQLQENISGFLEGQPLRLVNG